MDETQSSRVLDAGATRKRRSSILKSQRPPRTPFSELEFNVATPTDTAKSRRVSFSKRTGVAEFVTNEATTTWKNIYVEQNKSLEFHENDSVMNQPRQTIGHLGKRIFDQQFQEVEAVDYGGNGGMEVIMTSCNPRVQEMNMSLNVNFTQQIAALECEMNTRNFPAPQKDFELSSLTAQRSKLFGDDLTITTMGDMTNKIDINFSAIEPVGVNNNKCDDLDEIQRDLFMSRSTVCQGPISDRKSISEYIELDLNMTHIGMNNDELDMSLADTVENPKVEELSNNLSSKNEKRINKNIDWTVDKENIAINPYVAPRESANFAINELQDQVLVFDGRKLSIQSEKNKNYNKNRNEQDFRKTILPNESSDPPPQRKTITLNINDDLPNFIYDASSLDQIHGLSTRSVVDEKANIKTEIEHHFLQTVPSQVKSIANSHKTVIYDSEDIANISVTQAIPTNIILNKDRRNTIVFEHEAGNVSMTQALPTNVMISKEIPQNKTVLYDADNISYTQAVPMNILLSNKTKNICRNSVMPSPDNFDLSFTQAVPNNMVISDKSRELNKRNTIIYGTDTSDISMTRPISSNILIIDNKKDPIYKTTEDQNQYDKNKSIFFEKGCDISTTEAIPKNVILSNISLNKANNKDQYNISETQILPSNIIAFDQVIERDIAPHQNCNERKLPNNNNKFITRMSITETIPDNILLSNRSLIDKRESVDNEDSICDISITQALPSNIIIASKEQCPMQVFQEVPAECQNMISNGINNFSDQSVPENITLLNLPKTETGKKAYESPSENILHLCRKNEAQNEKLNNLTNDIDKCISNNSSERTELSKCNVDMSITQVLHPNDVTNKTNSTFKGKEIVSYGDVDIDISVTRAVPTNIMLSENKSKTDNILTTKTASENMVIKSYYPDENLSIRAEAVRDYTKQFSNNCEHYDSFSNTKSHELSKQDFDRSKMEFEDSNKLNVSINKNTQHNISHKSKNYLDELVQDFKTSKSVTEQNYQDVFVYQAVTSHNVSKHQLMRTEQGDTRVEGSEKTTIKSNILKQSDDSLLQETQFRDINTMEDMSEPELHTSHDKNKNKTILNELLSMSCESIDISSDGIDDKSVMVGKESRIALEKNKQDCNETNTTENELPARELETVSELRLNNLGPKYSVYEQKEINSSTQTQYHSENDGISHLQHNSVENTRNNEKLLSSNFERDRNTEEFEIKNLNNSGNKYLKDADDTNELMEMLSDFTDKSMVKQSKDEEKSTSMEVQGNGIMDEETILREPKRISLLKSRTSIMLSREDLLANISMAHAALQQATVMDESENFDDQEETTEDVNTSGSDKILEDVTSSRRKSVSVSTEVVKTLQFDDSANDVTMKSDSNLSPLRKSTLGDSYCLNESKAKVIPSYLKYVSDDIKSLMQDLVKPAAEVMPYETVGVDKIAKKDISTSSIKIQANIITSSQIDIDINSYPESHCDVILSETVKAFNDDINRFDVGETQKTSSECKISNISDSHYFQREPVLVFDHANPLNNVILSPSGQADAPKYSPKKHDQINDESKKSRQKSVLEKSLEEDMQVQRICTNYNINTSGIRSGTKLAYSNDEAVGNNSYKLNNYIQHPQDNTIDNKTVHDELKHSQDTEVNTLIVMKSNKELLEASSCLTIVDEERQDKEMNGVTVDSEVRSKRTSHVKFIFKQNDVNDNCDLSQSSVTESCAKAKKRNYCPAQHDQPKKASVSNPEVTPKPLSKMQRLSYSPHMHTKSTVNRASTAKSNNSHVENKGLTSEMSVNKSTNKNLQKDTKCPSKSKSNPRTSFIVQHLKSENKRSTEANEQFPISGDAQFSSCSTLKTETISHKDLTDCTSVDMINCLLDRNSSKEAQCMPSLTSTTVSQDVSSGTLSLDWQTKLDDKKCNNFLIEYESWKTENILDKINALSFMGGPECAWEHSDESTWRFRMMRGRLRLTISLKETSLRTRTHLHGDAMGGHVLPDTPILSTAVEFIHDEVDSLAVTCLGLASEAMRYECLRGATVAGDMPAVLRRCAQVSRVCRRWGRAMREAWVHLAFEISDGGKLVLKVANIPLITLFEVTLRIELVVEDARECAWARASHVAVRDVTASHAGHGASGALDVRRLLERMPHDWGNVPKTVWSIFKYLKHKGKDDELLGI